MHAVRRDMKLLTTHIIHLKTPALQNKHWQPWSAKPQPLQSADGRPSSRRRVGSSSRNQHRQGPCKAHLSSRSQPHEEGHDQDQRRGHIEAHAQQGPFVTPVPKHRGDLWVKQQQKNKSATINNWNSFHYGYLLCPTELRPAILGEVC